LVDGHHAQGPPVCLASGVFLSSIGNDLIR
jgi:hypothetical protein